MDLNIPIEQTWKAIERIWHTERTLFVGIMIAILVFVWFLIYSSNVNQAQERDAFLATMGKRDEQYLKSIDKVADALNKNTEIMTELKSKIK